MTDAILERARARELARLDAALDAVIDHGTALDYRALRTERDFTASQRWTPKRIPRRMPKLWVIASYWAERGTFGEVYLHGAPYCFGCHKHVPVRQLYTPNHVERWNKASLFIDRAHLVDRWNGGLDGPQNLVPLCYGCHKLMPSFQPEDAADAIAWVQAGGRWQVPEVVAEFERRFAAALNGELDDEDDSEPAMDDGGQFALR